MKKVGNYNDMSPYYRVAKLFHKGIRPYAHPGEYFLVEVDKENPYMRYKYRRFLEGADRHFFNTKPRQIKYIMGNKFIHKGNEVDTGTYPDYVTIPTRNWVIAVDHDPADNREADGR